MPFKIATWNVNSLRVRLPHVLEWIKEAKPDVLAMQETKLLDAYPIEEFREAGYEIVYSGQKSYNGVAVLSREEGKDFVTDFPTLEDPQRRVLGVTIGNMRIINLYIPNGDSLGSPKYQYKLGWLESLTAYIKEELEANPNLIILGDFNIAPEDRDVYDPAYWRGKVLCTPPERQSFQDLIDIGLTDCFRLHEQPPQSFTWWDYRMNDFNRNRGLRIDHILASTNLSQNCIKCYTDTVPRGWERPSDHTPVIAEFLT
jgi:exodeoxyribonuclease-3